MARKGRPARIDTAQQRDHHTPAAARGEAPTAPRDAPESAAVAEAAAASPSSIPSAAPAAPCPVRGASSATARDVGRPIPSHLPAYLGLTPDQYFGPQDADTKAMMLYLAAHMSDHNAVPDPAKLESEIKSLLDRDQVYSAHPLLCLKAWYQCLQPGIEHPDTLRAVHAVSGNLWHQGVPSAELITWLVPRYAAHFGPDHPDTRALVQLGGYLLCLAPDPRRHPSLTRVVTEAAQQLPGGLGWGSTVVAPVPDEEAYCRMAFTQAKGTKLLQTNQPELGKKFLERSAAYYETLGSHWLGTVRRVATLALIGDCDILAGNAADAEPTHLKAKRTAQRELGMEHFATIEATWQYGQCLYELKRHEQALSLFHKTLRLQQDIFGRTHWKTLMSQYGLAKTHQRLGRTEEATAMMRDLFETVLRVQGPRGLSTSYVLMLYWDTLYHDVGDKAQAEALRRTAEKQGCDVRVCVPGPRVR